MNWPPQSGEQYYGRGPIQLSWNYNYGAFSNILVESEYNSKMYLLNDPDKVVKDGYVAFSSALWFYMTPQSPKPSMHDVATCYFEPSNGDNTAGIKKWNNLNGFGITTNIINGGIECGTGGESASSQKRISFYEAWLEDFGLPTENDFSKMCGNMWNAFPSNSAGAAYGYWDRDWSGGKKCKAVNWMTGYSVYAPDDYKRCICDIYGSGAASCPTAERAEIPVVTEPVIIEPVTPDEPVITPEEPVVTPEEPVVTPEEPVVIPEEPVVTPEEPVVIPEEPVVTPEEPAEPIPEVDYVFHNKRCNNNQLNKFGGDWNQCDSCKPLTGPCSLSYPVGDAAKFSSGDAACRCNPDTFKYST